jgi:hypothetical protein
MKVIKPIAVTLAKLVSTTLLEPSAGDPPAWVTNTPYAVGARVHRTQTHRIYTRLVAGQTTTPPENDLTGDAPLWKDSGPTNAWAMFDDETNTRSIAQSLLRVVLQPGVFNSLALIELRGGSARIKVTDGIAGPVVYDKTFSLALNNVVDGYTYFFEPVRQKETLVRLDLPPYTNAVVTVEITGTAQIECGGLIAGTAYELGSTETGINFGIRDYSRKTTDADTGVTTLQERRFAKLMSAQVFLERGKTDYVNQVLTELRAKPCVWLGEPELGMDALTIFGWCKDFRGNLKEARHTVYSIEVEGMT